MRRLRLEPLQRGAIKGGRAQGDTDGILLPLGQLLQDGDEVDPGLRDQYPGLAHYLGVAPVDLPQFQQVLPDVPGQQVGPVVLPEEGVYILRVLIGQGYFGGVVQLGAVQVGLGVVIAQIGHP